MEDEFRKDFEELLRLMDAGKLQDFKKKAYECLPVDIAEGLETYRDVYGGTPAPVQTEAPDETETEPAPPEEDLPVNYGTTVEGIVSNDFAINVGEMFFERISHCGEILVFL